MKSIVEQRGAVVFPQFTGERIYMREFRKADGLPFDLARWQPTVDAMLDGVDTDGPIYLMVDQGLVRAGVSHRRPGLHIDGYWVPAVQAHGGGSGGGRHISQPPASSGSHRGNSGGHLAMPSEPARHRGNRGGHLASAWEGATFDAHEAIILASTITAARAFDGEFFGAPGEGGDCSHINASSLREVTLHAGRAYAGNVTMLHESLPVAADYLRTVVRLNVPGWTPAP